MKQYKVPKEVMELMYELEACEALAMEYGRGFFPSLKAIYYKHKATKAAHVIWRALEAAHSDLSDGEWILDTRAGTVTKKEDPAVLAPKPKKPRKPKVVQQPIAASAANEGEQ